MSENLSVTFEVNGTISLVCLQGAGHIIQVDMT